MAYTPTRNLGCTPKSKATCELLSEPVRERAELDSHVSSETYIEDTTKLRQEVNEALSLAARMFPPEDPSAYNETEYKAVSEYAEATNPALFERARSAIVEIMFEDWFYGDGSTDDSLDDDGDDDDGDTDESNVKYVPTVVATRGEMRAFLAEAEADLERKATLLTSYKESVDVMLPYMTEDTTTIAQAHALWLADLEHDPRHDARWRAARAMVALREAGDEHA